MKKVLADYLVSPKIVPSGKARNILIRPLGAHAAFQEKEYVVQYVPMSSSREPAYDYDTRTVTVDEDGCIRLNHTFTGEQEYKIRLFSPADCKPGQKLRPEKKKLDVRVYSLREDLYARRPFRGDFHTHTCCSDGSEAPEITASNFRKNGFDFYAVTDHHLYRPSVQCKAYYDAKPVDFRVVHGEEVHAPGNHVHIINFGGAESVNEIFLRDPDAYEAEVREILAGLTVPEGVNGYEYASCLWVFRKIRETGGLSLYCHPHWMADAYHIPDAFSDVIFESGEFDAFELLGGHEVFSNNLQIEYYNEKAAEGKKYPVVGVSDAHNTGEGADWFNWTTTIVFAPSLEVADIQDSVRDYYSVAVETYPLEQSRAHGSFRMVKYAKFLLEEYFPVHDELCYEEGRLMKDMFLGDEKAEELLAMMQGRCQRLLEQYWGEPQ